MRWIAGSLLMATLGFFLGSRDARPPELSADAERGTRLLTPEKRRAATIVEMSADELVDAAEARRTVPGRERTHLRFADWAESNPEAAMKSVMTFIPHEWRKELGLIVLETVAEKDIGQAVDLMLDPGFQSRWLTNHWLLKTVPRWLQRDFDVAAPVMLDRISEFQTILNHGFEWQQLFCDSFFDGDDKVVAFMAQMSGGSQITSGWEGDSDAEAWKLTSVDAVLSIAEPRTRDNGLIFAIANSDPEYAVQWIPLLSSSEAKERGIDAYLRNVKANRPDELAAAREKFQRESPGDETGEIDIPHVEAVSKAMEQDDEMKLRKAVQKWVAAEPESGSVWIRDLPESMERDRVVTDLVRHLSDSDPAAAYSWAESLKNVELRERFVRVALRHWRVADPEGALQAIQGASISGAARQSLLRRLER